MLTWEDTKSIRLKRRHANRKRQSAIRLLPHMRRMLRSTIRQLFALRVLYVLSAVAQHGGLAEQLTQTSQLAKCSVGEGALIAAGRNITRHP